VQRVEKVVRSGDQEHSRADDGDERPEERFAEKPAAATARIGAVPPPRACRTISICGSNVRLT